MSPFKLRRKALRHAQFHVGNMEQGGNNRGQQVEEIIRYARGIVGEPWCVDFVIWCYGHAGSQKVKPGFTRAVRFMLAGNGIERVEGKAHSGNIVRYNFDHTGLLKYPCTASGRRTLWRFATHIKTVEGNTSALGAVSDGDGGDGVYVKVRNRALVRDYLRVTA